MMKERNTIDMLLPDIEIAKNYFTIGPNGKEQMNINGKACSIELYLGKDVLTKDDEFIPIQWTSYKNKIGTYQGDIGINSRKVIDILTFSRYIIYSKFDQSNIVYHSRMSGMIADLMPGH